MSAGMIASTLKAIRQRRPNAAATHLAQLLEGDRDRALTTLSRLRGETLDLHALSDDDEPSSSVASKIVLSSFRA